MGVACAAAWALQCDAINKIRARAAGWGVGNEPSGSGAGGEGEAAWEPG